MQENCYKLLVLNRCIFGSIEFLDKPYVGLTNKTQGLTTKHVHVLMAPISLVGGFQQSLISQQMGLWSSPTTFTGLKQSISWDDVVDITHWSRRIFTEVWKYACLYFIHPPIVSHIIYIYICNTPIIAPYCLIHYKHQPTNQVADSLSRKHIHSFGQRKTNVWDWVRLLLANEST